MDHFPLKSDGFFSVWSSLQLHQTALIFSIAWRSCNLSMSNFHLSFLFKGFLLMQMFKYQQHCLQIEAWNDCHGEIPVILQWGWRAFLVPCSRSEQTTSAAFFCCHFYDCFHCRNDKVIFHITLLFRQFFTENFAKQQWSIWAPLQALRVSKGVCMPSLLVSFYVKNWWVSFQEC